MKQIAYSKSALKSLRRIPADQSKLIRAKIEQFASNPADVANNIKALTGSNYIRLRVGGWRVIMNNQGVVLEILKIAARGSVY